MQLVSETSKQQPLAETHTAIDIHIDPNCYTQYKIIRRNGAVVAFEPVKISVAMTKSVSCCRWWARCRIGTCTRTGYTPDTRCLQCLDTSQTGKVVLSTLKMFRIKSSLH